jgi:hypothetical protein
MTWTLSVAFNGHLPVTNKNVLHCYKNDIKVINCSVLKRNNYLKTYIRYIKLFNLEIVKIEPLIFVKCNSFDNYLPIQPFILYSTSSVYIMHYGFSIPLSTVFHL